jgi:Mg/Co/Ni transporter MgtE
MPLKRLGVVGDLLTGITLSCVYLFGILVPAKYWFGDDTLHSHEDWVVTTVVAVAVGVVVTVAYWVNVRRLKKG